MRALRCMLLCLSVLLASSAFAQIENQYKPYANPEDNKLKPEYKPYPPPPRTTELEMPLEFVKKFAAIHCKDLWKIAGNVANNAFEGKCLEAKDWGTIKAASAQAQFACEDAGKKMSAGERNKHMMLCESTSVLLLNRFEGFAAGVKSVKCPGAPSSSSDGVETIH